MLIYAQLFGSSVNRTLALDMRADETIGDLQKRILQLNSGIVIKRCIFAGKQLDDLNKTIAQYDVHKESTIQVFTGPIKSAEDEEKEKIDAENAEEKDDKEKNEAAAAAAKPSADASSSSADSDALPALSSRPFMVRQPTNEDIQYGDILVVKLISAKNLIAVDWNGTSDPYAILAVDKQSSKSSMIKRKLNPQWNETFFFWLDLEAGSTTVSASSTPVKSKAGSSSSSSSSSNKNDKDALSIPPSGVRARSEASNAKVKKGGLPKPDMRHLSVMLFDHDWVRHDESLGYFEISLDDIPRNTYLEKTYSLQGVKNGEVALSLQRCTLTSPQMKAILKSLVSLGRPIKHADLNAKGVTLSHLLGREPYISLPAPGSKKSSARDIDAAVAANGGHSIQYLPALSHLASLILNPASRFSASNLRTLTKVQYILKTQGVTDLSEDLPTRYLWFSNLNNAELSPSNLFILLRKHFPNRIKRMLIPRSARQGAAYVWFKRTEDAILALLATLDLRPLRAAFGNSFEPTDKLLFSSLKAGLLNCAGPINTDQIPTATSLSAAELASAMSDDLPPPMGGSAPSTDRPTATGGKNHSLAVPATSRATSLMRQNSNCNNDAPIQKGKHDLEWTSHWVFVSAPDEENNVPATLYALRRTTDYSSSNPEESKWAFKVALTPKNCIVVKSGAWSIQVIAFEDEAEGAAAHEEEEEEEKKCSDEVLGMVEGEAGAIAAGGADSDALPIQSSPELSRRLTVPVKTRSQKSFYIRAHSAAQLDEWLALLKACRAGETLLSPSVKKPTGNFAAGFDHTGFPVSAAAVSPASTSPATTSPPLSPGGATPFYEEVLTRVFCTSCNQSKSVLDIYTLDAALDVVPTHSQEAKKQKTPAMPSLSLPAAATPSSSSSSAVAPAPAMTAITQFTINSCRDCLVKTIQGHLDAKRFDDLSANFSVQDLQDLLPRKAFNDYLDQSISALVDSNPKRYVRCPKCACPLEMDHHSWSSKSEQFLVGMLGLDKQPLDEAAKSFFLSNRFLCRGCRTDFCRACKCFPFHPGYSCAEYQEYLNAPKCRFCAQVVTNRTRMLNPPSLAFHDVCNAAECKEKVDASCCVMKRCGHPCPGARDELECPPCMVPDCEDCDPKADGAEDTCSICYTEELGQAPIVKLQCGHIFHYGCVRSRLNAKWSGTRISFEFLGCPLCNKKMEHMLLTDLLRPFYHLESQVRALSVQRLEFEALTDHVDIVSPEGRYYQDPEGFAVNHYMFYQCYECQEPYFAGARACGAAGAEEVKKEDLICGGCQKVASFDECPTHGASFLIFKCRFCCTFSTFFCFGKTHFCDACHSGSVWPTLVTSAGVNLKKWEEYNQCTGIKAKVLAITSSSLSKEEQDKQLATTYCDPTQCPLGIRHLPSGFEFGFGCGMCKPSDQKNTEIERLKAEEDKKMKNALREGAKEIRRWKIEDEGVIVKRPEAGDAAAPEAAVVAAEPVMAPEKPISFSLHAEAGSSVLGLRPPQAVVSNATSLGASLGHDVLLRHSLHADGDDLELIPVNGEGDVVPLALSDSSTPQWFHLQAKRAVSYGCHFFQFKIVAMPPKLYHDANDKSALAWSSAQMIVGIKEEEAVVPISSTMSGAASAPLSFYQNASPGFVSNGSTINVATGELTEPQVCSSWREGDVIGVFLDLDQPSGIEMSFYLNGFMQSTQTYRGLKVHAKHHRVKLVASFRGAGFMVQLSDVSFIDRALWRFDVDNALPSQERLPAGVRKLPAMSQQDASKNFLRWIAHVEKEQKIDVVESGIDAEEIDEEKEEPENEDEEEYVLLAGQHHPNTLRLIPNKSNFCIVKGMEVMYGAGGNGAVCNCQTNVGLPIWGESNMQYWEITVLDRGQGGFIGMGFTKAGYPAARMPGWNFGSYGYHGDDGKKFASNSFGHAYGPTWKVGDTIGCCIDRAKKEVFYTHNGQKLAVAFTGFNIEAKWLPTIGFHSEGERVSVNFEGPFVWTGLDQFPLKVKRSQAAVDKASVRMMLNNLILARNPRAARKSVKIAEDDLQLIPVDNNDDDWNDDDVPPAPPLEPQQPMPMQDLLEQIRKRRLGLVYHKKPEDDHLLVNNIEYMALPVRGGGGNVDEHKEDGNIPQAPPISPRLFPRRRGSFKLEDKPAANNNNNNNEEEPVPDEFKEVEHPPGNWSCAACTFENEEVVLACAICGTPRGQAVAAAPAAAAGAIPLPPPAPPVEILAIPPPPPIVDHAVAPAAPPPPPPGFFIPPPPPPPAADAPPPPYEEIERPASPGIPIHRLVPGLFVQREEPLIPIHRPAPPEINIHRPAPVLEGDRLPIRNRPVVLPDGIHPLPQVQKPVPIAPPLHIAPAINPPIAPLMPSSSSSSIPIAPPLYPDQDPVYLAERARQVEEREKKERELEEHLEFDGVNHRPLVLELRGSAALALDVPLVSAPRGNGGMERWAVQAKEGIKAYTLVMDIMLPKGQLNVGKENNPNLRYFPLFDSFFTPALNDPMSAKPFFVHPTGVVSSIANAARKDPDPVLKDAQWSRLVVIVDTVRDRYEVWIDGVECKLGMQNFKNQGEKVKKLEIANENANSTKKQLRLFAGQTDIRKSDALHTKCKRLRQVQLFHRALGAGEIWKLSGGGGDGQFNGNPLNHLYAGLMFQQLPSLAADAPLVSAHPIGALDKLSSKLYFIGGIKDNIPTGAVFEVDMRAKPLVVKTDKVSPVPRAHSSAVFYKGSVYVFGGMSESKGKALNSMTIYTPKTGEFELREFDTKSVPAMFGHSALVIDDAMYVVGIDSNAGQGPAQYLGVWQYRFASNTWKLVKLVRSKEAEAAAKKREADVEAAAAASAASASSSSSSSSISAPKSFAAAASEGVEAAEKRITSKGVWQACVGSYGHTIVVFGGSNSPQGRKAKFTGKGVAAEFVLDPESLSTATPKASWRNLLSPVAVGKERGSPDATRIFGAGGMVPVGNELFFYGGTSAEVRSVLYAYHTLNHKWRVVPLAEAVPALPRCNHSIAFDPITGNLLLVGGVDSNGRPVLVPHVIPVKNAGF